MLLAADWQNSLNRLDISDNGVVTPFDALTVINELNLRRISDGTGQLPPRPPDWPPGDLIDADGSGSVSPFDALLVINALNGDRQPPTLTAGLLADTAPQGTFNSDGVTSSATITGQVHDALTGVASLQAQIDQGPLVFVNYDPRLGNFTLGSEPLPGRHSRWPAHHSFPGSGLGGKPVARDRCLVHTRYAKSPAAGGGPVADVRPGRAAGRHHERRTRDARRTHRPEHSRSRSQGPLVRPCRLPAAIFSSRA